MEQRALPEKIRVSSGSAIVLGLLRGKLDAKPTTAYLLTYRPGKCSANCSFCPQAQSSRGRADMLSRITWPLFSTRQVLTGIEQAVQDDSIQRVCLQTLNYPTVFDDISRLIRSILSRVSVPISVSCQPLTSGEIQQLAATGVDRITIPLDAATKTLFEKIKGHLVGGPYLWERQREALKRAVEIVGRDHVGTHLIVGLGETERDMVQTIQWCTDTGIYPGLFAFTPIAGTVLQNHPRPPLASYRRIQLAHHLLTTRKAQYDQMAFDTDSRLVAFGLPESSLTRVIRTGTPFQTSGCPGCNRPYYNEKPSGPIYNYPRRLQSDEIAEIERQLGIVSIVRTGSSQH